LTIFLLNLFFGATSAFCQKNVEIQPELQTCESLGLMAKYVPRCGGTPPKIRSIGERGQLLKSWTTSYLQCTKTGVPKLDDVSSDASTIAIGLQGLCSAQ
jgi:hypothetical protein